MRIPPLRRNTDGRAFVEIPRSGRKRVYLGRHGTPEAEAEYRSWLARWLATRHNQPPAPPVSAQPLVKELVARYALWAQTYYSDEGQPTKEYRKMLEALKPLSLMFGDELGATFGPKSLKLLQSHLSQQNYARTHINALIGRVKRFFRWCASEELIPGAVYHDLRTVAGLPKGRGLARESEPVRPVPWEHVQQLLPYLSPPVAAMVQIQYFCGLRPGEAVILRDCDLDRSGPIWLYVPARHKNQWRAQSLVKAVPLVAQQVLQPFLNRAATPESFLFSPAESDLWARARRANPERKTPVYPSELRRRERDRAKHPTRATCRTHYDTLTYNQALRYGFRRAERDGVVIPRWSPGRLRHLIATEIRQTLGQQAAQSWLGHAHLETTGIYAERQASELVRIAERLDQVWRARAS